MTNFSDFGHPKFRASCAFERGEWRSEGHGKKSIHFDGSDENIELLLRTVPRNEKKTHVRRWIRKNTRIGTVLNMKVCCHDDRYSFEVQVPSLFQDNTASLVRIVNGVDKYVTESMLTKEEEDIASGTSLLKQDQDRSPQ